MLTRIQAEVALEKYTKGMCGHNPLWVGPNADPRSIDRRTGQLVAIKVIDVENAEDEVDDIISEISILSGMNSSYVTKYYGSYLHGSDLWIVMEFCSGGSCADLMKPGPIGENEIAVMLKELLMGLSYLHDDNKLHRDIKGRLRDKECYVLC
jgi:serine/threonine-protein kinase 24/25/MST4